MTILLWLFLAASLTAQSLPDNLVGVGVAFQSADDPKGSGWLTLCRRTGERVAMCAATDYTANSSSQRLEVMNLVFQLKRLRVFGKAGVGAAQGADALGAAFSAGGVAMFDLKPGLHAVMSISWMKQNVTVLTGNVIQEYASKATFRFGIAHSW